MGLTPLIGGRSPHGVGPLEGTIPAARRVVEDHGRDPHEIEVTASGVQASPELCSATPSWARHGRSCGCVRNCASAPNLERGRLDMGRNAAHEAVHQAVHYTWDAERVAAEVSFGG